MNDTIPFVIKLQSLLYFSEKLAYLVDGSTDTNVHMIRATYAELIKEGFTLRYVVVTHPDKDHYGGINRVLGFNGVDSPQVLLTNRFSDEIKNKMLGEQYIQVQSLTPIDWPPPYIENKCFNVSHSSFTSDLVLYRMRTADEQPIILKQNGTFKKPEKKKDNESSIITTITTKNDDNAILACLTGDAFFATSEIAAQFLHNKKIIVFQVPHHGSKHNSNFEFYEQIAENTQYYLISCGHHGKHCFPDKDVFTSIRKATVEKNKKGATIVLTDGTNLNGEKVSFFTGHDHEPSISYWDPLLRRSDCKLIDKDFLQFTFSSQGDLDNDKPALPNLIQWSITGYREITLNYGSKIRLRGMHFKAPNNRHLKVVKGVLKTEECQGDECNASIEGFPGLPAPTDPCTWDKRVIMVYGTDDLVFLQLTTGENIVIQKHKYENVQKEFEERISSKVYKSCLRKACEYKEIVSLLSKAITTIIFRTIFIPAKKLELIEEVKTAIETTKDTDIYSMQTITENYCDKNERDVVMSLLELEYQIRQSLLRNSKYNRKELLQKLDQIEKNNQKSLLKYSPQDIISFGKQRFCFFKCYKLPWQIVYGTISDNGNVNWPDQHDVHNSLQVYTPMTPLDF